jgi:two-component system sensor kinase
MGAARNSLDLVEPRALEAAELDAGAPPGGGEALIGGRFRVVQPLKRGGGVETLLGWDVVGRESVVIKRASGDVLSAGTQMRLEHEAGVLREAQGPWLAPLRHLGREDGQFYLVMPYIRGITLEKRLSAGALSVRDTLTVGRCLMAALRQVHDRGVVHRDLKPANIIVDEGTPLQSATLIDFGLAWSSRLDATIRERTVGTVRYTSPEQAGLLDRDADERSDLYSAGVVLFECLAGRPLFQGDGVGEVLRQHMTVRPPELRSLGLAVPRALDEVVQRLLRKDPRDRYQSAEAVFADLTLIAEALEKDVAEPMLVVGLRDRRRTLTEPAFVGREHELAALDAQISRARRGEGGVVLLEAESGGGKSRLLAEAGQQGARQGAWVLRGQGLDQAAQRPFQVLAGVAAGILEAAQEDPDLGERISAYLGANRAATADALPELAELLGNPSGSKLGPESFGQVRSLQALAALLDALGTPERPALVLLDDCQWADELALKLLGHWLRRRDSFEHTSGVPRHVLVVVAFRAEDVPANHYLRSLQSSLHLRPLPFGRADVRRLAESMAGPLPDEAIAVVERLSEGSPFMAAAVLQGLVESGALVAESSGWRAEPLALADVQSSRHAAAFLARRVDLLPAEVVRLLSAGAVLGKEFDLVLAATLAGQTPAEAILAVDEARRRHIVWAKDRETHCAFLHDKLRQMLLDRLPEAERRQLHRRAALLLEEQGAENAEEEAPRAFDLAYHFDCAGEPGRALPYALASADQARSQHSLEVAEQQYRIARRAVSDSDSETRFRVAEGLGDVLMLRGRYDEAAQEFEMALELAQGDTARARIEGKLGDLAFKRGDVQTAEGRVEQALRLLGKRVPRRWLTF